MTKANLFGFSADKYFESVSPLVTITETTIEEETRISVDKLKLQQQN